MTALTKGVAAPAPSTPPFETALAAFLAQRFSRLHAVVLVIFALASVGYGAGLVGAAPRGDALAAVVVVLGLLAFQLAVADAIRDQAHANGHWREPVARPALLTLAAGAAGVQALLTTALHPPALGPLMMAWLVILLVSQDFFVPDLARRPGLSVGLHLLAPAIAGLFAAGLEPLRRTGEVSGAIGGYLVLTLACGFGLEIARKSQAAIDERPTEATYTQAWGPTLAGMIAALAAVLAIVGALAAGLGQATPRQWLLAPVLAGGLAFWAAITFAKRPIRRHADRMRMAMAVLAIIAFAALGLAPLLLR
jgi:hypothetical protein